MVDQDFGKTAVKSKYVFIYQYSGLKGKGKVARWFNILYIKYCNTLLKPLILSILNK